MTESIVYEKVISTVISLRKYCITDLIYHMSGVVIGLPQNTGSHECEDWHNAVDNQIRKYSG